MSPSKKLPDIPSNLPVLQLIEERTEHNVHDPLSLCSDSGLLGMGRGRGYPEGGGQSH